MMRMTTTGERIATRCTTRKHPDKLRLKSAKTSYSRERILGKQWKSSGNGRVEPPSSSTKNRAFSGQGSCSCAKGYPHASRANGNQFETEVWITARWEPHARWFGLIELSRDFLGAGYWKGIPPFLCVCCVLFYFLFRVRGSEVELLTQNIEKMIILAPNVGTTFGTSP